MENYKNKSIDLGISDYATLILVGCRKDEGLKTESLLFGEDGSYSAWLVDDETVAIPDHYKLVATFNGWLKVYDDDGLTAYLKSKTIEIYRAGSFGVLVRIIK